jgi:hypothetical protein
VNDDVWRWAGAALIAVHGLIHLVGFAKGFELGEFEDLTHPVSRRAGVAWLAACLGMLGIAALYLWNVPGWWGAAFAAVALSQAVILSAWEDARFGTFPNLVILALAIRAWMG